MFEHLQHNGLVSYYHEKDGVSDLNGGSSFTFSEGEVAKMRKLTKAKGHPTAIVKAFAHQIGTAHHLDTGEVRLDVVGAEVATTLRVLLSKGEFAPNK
ncbi:MAG: hypothetical protein WAV40_02020 [Microgenomates group bacterium]